VRARFNVAIRTAVVDRDTGRAVYGDGGGITWSSEAAAEHAEVLAKAATLNRRHQDFELIEIMRYVPERGRRNRNRHLRRMADSAEYHVVPFRPGSGHPRGRRRTRRLLVSWLYHQTNLRNPTSTDTADIPTSTRSS
jgi:chorismate binding enzyme